MYKSVRYIVQISIENFRVVASRDDSLSLVPRVGLEPTRAFRSGDFKSPTSTIPSPRRGGALYHLEAPGGIEPPHRGFADRCVTSSPRRPYVIYYKESYVPDWKFTVATTHQYVSGFFHLDQVRIECAAFSGAEHAPKDTVGNLVPVV